MTCCELTLRCWRPLARRPISPLGAIITTHASPSTGGKTARAKGTKNGTANKSGAPLRERIFGWVTLAFRIWVGAVFLWAGAVKIPALEEFVISVRAYQILPLELTRPVAYVLPFVEVAIGLMLIVGIFHRLAGATTAFLLVVFMVAIISVWVRGIAVDCGCFGGGGEVAQEETEYGMKIVENTIWFLASMWVVVKPKSPLSLQDKVFPEIELEGADR
ncbi:hypothetical protein CGZ91_00715 [Parenemella sanctibonifatiensis]|uniref:Methylamine utilisation protein MauE domain-containing protein n=1 Tax=Parenemella sanctibonifatiensis TaxID=2016505 RepID=A0A255EKN0_9ACTN|nr:hypothetical protein CGZ91_00715 [Parenemella sanctibonifatiensis]